MKFHHVGIVLAAGFILLPNHQHSASAARPIRRILQSEGDDINLVAFDEANMTVEGDSMSSESSMSSSGSSSCGGHHERCCLGEEILCYGGYGCYFGLNSTGDPDPSVPYPKCQPRCGGAGLPCCQSTCTDDCACECGPGTKFNVATKLCDECGMKKDQPCCEGGCLGTDVETGVALTCSRATGKCVECGTDGKAACDKGCLPGFVPQAGHVCKTCGMEEGQPCCKNNLVTPCLGNLECGVGHLCVVGGCSDELLACPFLDGNDEEYGCEFILATQTAFLESSDDEMKKIIAKRLLKQLTRFLVRNGGVEVTDEEIIPCIRAILPQVDL